MYRSKSICPKLALISLPSREPSLTSSIPHTMVNSTPCKRTCANPNSVTQYSFFLGTEAGLKLCHGVHMNLVQVFLRHLESAWNISRHQYAEVETPASIAAIFWANKGGLVLGRKKPLAGAVPVIGSRDADGRKIQALELPTRLDSRFQMLRNKKETPKAHQQQSCCLSHSH